jgi:hypothetical protein
MQAPQDFLNTHAPQTAASGWQQQGSGILSWSVFPIYRATLWTAGALQIEGEELHNHVFALQFGYLRKVSSEHTIEASSREISRLHAHIPQEILDGWLATLSRILPDTEKHDELWAIFDLNHGVSFFSNDQPLGQIDDATFSKAFADVWFHLNCHSPKLRQALLGTRAL